MEDQVKERTNIAIKGRVKGDKTFAFLTSKGYLNRLRIYAAMMTPTRADELLKEFSEQNPDMEFKIVQLFK